jgi:excisionase family DNA binding protein
MEGYMTTKEAADFLGITQTSVSRLINRNLLKATRFGPVWMVEEQSVKEYHERNKGKSPHDPTRGEVGQD